MKANNIFSLARLLPDPGKKLFWFCLLFAIKFSFLAIFVSQHRPTLLPETIGVCSGDCDGYLTPIDELFNSGKYSPDYRMPGYGLPYFIFRLFFEKNMSVNLLVIFQTFVDVIASLLLCLSLYKLTEKKSGFYLVFLFYGVGVTVSCYNNWILTESLTASALAIGFYFLVRHYKEQKLQFLIFAGCFFTWSYFLRPVNASIIGIILLMIFFTYKKHRIKYSLAFLIPVIVFNSLWTYRNYKDKNKIFLLTEQPYSMTFYKEVGLELISFCKTFSDFKKTTNFFETMGLTYFGQPIQTTKIEDIKIPEEIYTEDFNQDSLLLIRNLFKEKRIEGISESRIEELDNLIISKLKLYSKSIKEHHPLIVYVKTPLVLSKEFILQSGVHNLFFMPFSYLSTGKKLIKLAFISIYCSAFIFFLLGIIIYHKQIINNKMILTGYLIAFYIIFIHSLFLRSIEPRYLVPAYVFFVVGGVYSIILLKASIQTKSKMNG